GNRASEANTLNNMGNVYAGLGARQKALEYYNLSLPLWRAIGNQWGAARTLGNIGKVYADAGEWQQAAKFYNESLPLWRAVGDRTGEALTLVNLMALWRALDKPALAIFYGKQAVNTYQQLRSNIKDLDKELQQTYLKTVADYYHQLADLLIANQHLPEAQQVLAMLKEEEYFDFVRRDGAATDSLTTRATLNPEEAALETEYNKVAEEVTLIGSQRG